MESPTAHDFVALARRIGVELSDQRAGMLASMAPGSLDAFRFVEDQPDERRELPARAAAQVPEHNPLNAWAVVGSIKTTKTGRLAGRTVAIKDSIAVAGWPMANGTDFLTSYVPNEDATVVQRLLAEGGEIVGKSQCEYLCASGGSHTSAAGPVLNPHDPTRMAGGSSSGSAALVASGGVDLALGGDQGGSIRMPSSYSGTVGMKPTFGLVPYTGAASIEATIDHLGPITATVADNAILLEILAGPDGFDDRQFPREPDSYTSGLSRGVSGLRIGVVTEGFGGVNADPGVDARVRNSLAQLRHAGAVVEDVSVPMHLAGSAIFLPIVLLGFLHDVLDGGGIGTGRSGRQATDYGDANRLMGAHLEHAPANTLLLTLVAAHVRQASGYRHYAKAQQLKRQLRQAYDEALTRFDVLVMPTTPTTAPPIPDLGDDVAVIEAAQAPLANTAAFNATGHPAISVPAGPLRGLPVGAMFIGRAFDEATLYTVAAAFEALDHEAVEGLD